MNEERVRVTPFGELSQDVKDSFFERANWHVHGDVWGSWTRVRDLRYGTIEHVLVEDGTHAYDKINIRLIPGAYVVLVRMNPQSKAEFYLTKELRVLLPDEQGNRGTVYLDTVPQGVIRTWTNESPEEAARREVRQETGYEPIGLVYLAKTYLTPANSDTVHHFFLGLVPYTQKQGEQQLELGEHIQKGEWLSYQELLPRYKALKDGIAKQAFADAFDVLRPELLR